MKDSFIIRLEEGMPKGTAQQKGECIRYKKDENGRVRPYIHHFKKDEVSALREELEWKLKPHRPKAPSENPIRLFIVAYFNTSNRSKWGKVKPTRPDCDNWAKECIDSMSPYFFKDDSLIVDLHIKKYYAEKASIYIEWEELV